MGRWRLTGHEHSHRLNTTTVALHNDGSKWSMSPEKAHSAFASDDPDTSRIWWTDVGVHQNMTFGVHPDPVSGMHCWHQAVRVVKAHEGDHAGDIFVDTDRSRAVYRSWLEKTRSATVVSPNGERRPRWLIRPLKPTADAFRIGGPVGRRTGDAPVAG
jgi:hypothetical protein